MKRYIRATTIPDDVVKQARDYLEGSGDKGSIIDIPNHRMEIVWYKGATEDKIMEEGCMGDWLKQRGFNLSFEVKDVPYTTQSRTREGCRFGALGSNIPAHTAYLRNRLVMTVTW